MGTVYRHFPDKDALLEALAREQFDLLTEWAREALEAPDPGPALEALLWRGAELQANGPRADGGGRRLQARASPSRPPSCTPAWSSC